MATDKPRFTITIDPDMLDEVLAYKENNKLSTQSKAIQRLIEIGIKDTLSSSSNAPAQMHLSPDEQLLITLWRLADERDRETIWHILGRYDEEATPAHTSAG